MSPSDSPKFTGWITLLLLVSLPEQVFTGLMDRSRFLLSEDTKDHIRQLYANPYLPDLINDPEYQKLYLTVVFRHFRDDFKRNGIGGWDRSHWPTVLQAFDLLPINYHVIRSAEGQDKLRSFWDTSRRNLPANPIPDYGRTVVRVPQFMASVFQDDLNYRPRTQTIRYRYLVDEMQRFVVRMRTPLNAFNFASRDGKVNNFKAIYWLTVIGQFIEEVQRKEREDGKAPPRSPFPPIELLVGATNPVAQQADPRDGSMAQPVENPSAQPGPSGSNPERRAPSAAVGSPQVANPNVGGGVNSGEGAEVPLAPPQAAGGSSSSGGNLEPMSPAKAPNSGPNKGIVPVAVAWKPWQVVAYQILDSMKEPIYRRDIHHWPGHVGGSYHEEGETGPLGPGASGGGGVGGNPAAAPNHEVKRKPTDQGGGPSKGGKRGFGGAMRSMDEPRVGHKAHHHARKFKSGAKSHPGHGQHS